MHVQLLSRATDLNLAWAFMYTPNLCMQVAKVPLACLFTQARLSFPPTYAISAQISHAGLF